MPSGSSRRPTGTVPKTKPTRKNSVPQEMVAPTRRDLQEHLNEFFASVAERASKPDNNQGRTASDTCFDFDNLGLQENTKFCWPVRPIPRRNLLQDDMNDSHSLNLNLNGSNAAIGVVMPTTPFHQEVNDHSQQPYIQTTGQTPRPSYTSDSLIDPSSLLLRTGTGGGSGGGGTTSGSGGIPQSSVSNANGSVNVEERFNQIQEYIRITSNLINSIQSEKSNQDNIEVVATLVGSLENLKISEQKLLRSAKSNSIANCNQQEMDESAGGAAATIAGTAAGTMNGTILNSANLENVQSPVEINGARPQSVSSVYTSNPNTPTYEELQSKLEQSNRNMQNIKEQHNQLLRLQQTAKQQLNDMENVRDQQLPMSFASNQNGLPNYENTEEVQNDVETLMDRMKMLADFIQNQNELATMIGGEKSDVLDEQMQLQQRLNELKNKKQQMANLVNELQSMNGEIKSNYRSQDRDQTPIRNIPIDYERIVPIELVQAQRNATNIPIPISRYSGQPQNTNQTNNNAKQQFDNKRDTEPEEDDDEDDDENNMFSDKIAEINAMKNQLKRLQDMMQTVKLIEMKNGDAEAYDNSAKSSRSQSHYEPPPSDAEYSIGTGPGQRQSVVKSVNNTNASTTEQPQRDDDQSNIDERVRQLQSMTQDLKMQAVSLAAERDRLKDIKNEMFQRRDVESTNNKNIKQKRDTNVSGGKDQDQDVLVKSDYEQKKKEFDNLVEKLDNDLEVNDVRDQQSDAGFYAGAWRRPPTVSRSSPLRQSVPKPNAQNGNQCKDSTDSGAADVLGMSVDAGSLQSGSSRGFSVPPPMRNIGSRDAHVWRKSSQETSRISSINQPNSNFDNNHESYPNWYYNNYGCNIRPQSPPCAHYHHGEQHCCRPPYHGNLPSMPPGSGSDPMLIQQFIQTQQMLINSVCQCNQLLWDQQREINNLNSAVLLLQERVLNNHDPPSSVRAESVPPNVTCPNPQAFLPRAQSEQLLNNHNSGCFSNTIHGYNQLNAPQRQQSHPCQSHLLYRNIQNANNRISRCANINTAAHHSLLSQQHRDATVNFYQNEAMNNTTASSAALAAGANSQIFPNNYINPQIPLQPISSQANVMLNNDLNSPLLNTSSSQCQPSSPPIFIHHNNNTNVNNNNNANINNQLHQQNLAVAAATTTTGTSSAFSPPVPPALNNQVPPGNRANNYWDNFRSYSRQNLLSTNSCKSNEDACSSSNSPHSREQNYQTARNPPPTQMTHNNLPTMGHNKYLVHFRNQINQQQNTASAAAAAVVAAVAAAGAAPPDVLNINQHHHHQQQHHQQQHHQQQNNDNLSDGGASSNFNNLNISAGVPQPQASNQSSGNFNINAINLELNELKPNTVKMLPKGSTGGSKRIRQIREREQNNLSGNQGAGNGIDLNLASTVNRSESKSSAKLFESLKENVYLEVSALIAANESRPHFLINLFRELQLLSTSDPLRNRLMQAFQELYSRYSEQTIQEENSSLSLQNDATPENPQHDSTQSSDNRYNQSVNSVDFPSAESTPVRVPDLHASIDEDILRPLLLEIAEFLTTVDQINECAYQKIAQIVFRFIHSPNNKQSINLNKYSLSQDEFVRNLHNLDRHNREIFLDGLENFLNSILTQNNSTTLSNQPQHEVEDELYQRRPTEGFLDLTAPSILCKSSNEAMSGVRKKDETITLADVVAVIGHLPAEEDNQDLAEADQICSSDDVYSAEDEMNDHSNDFGAVGGTATVAQATSICGNVSGEFGAESIGGGAVGAIAMSTLPDLAKVTPTPTNNSLEEESVWMANEEVERIINQANLPDSVSGNINLNGDPKQKNL